MKPISPPGTRVEVLLHRGRADEFVGAVTTDHGVLLDQPTPDGRRAVPFDAVAEWRLPAVERR